ncbi:MAG: substrate-binding domain-containing protein [Actinobacteria bacterium]|nr:substrate-binding domain-containing protein [Actinomycetota bacterium]
MKKILLFVLIFLLLISMVVTFSLVGCKVEEVTPTEEEEVAPAVEEEVVEEEAVQAEEEDYTFAFVFGVDVPFYTAMQTATQKKADELGVNVIFQTPEEWSAEIQTPIIESLVARGDIDLLIFVSTDFEGMLPVAKKVYDKGIPVITVDGWVGDGDYSEGEDSFALTHIGSDNYDAGMAMGEAIAEVIGGEGKVFTMNSRAGLQSNEDRYNGCAAAFEKYPGIEDLGQEYCFNDPDKAQQLTRAFIEANPEVTYVWGVDLMAAQGAGMAIQNLGRDDIGAGAFDATEFAIEKLEEGLFNLVLAQMPGEMGALAIESGYNYLKSGTEPEVRIKTGYVFFNADNVDDPDMQQYIY